MCVLSCLTQVVSQEVLLKSYSKELITFPGCDSHFAPSADRRVAVREDNGEQRSRLVTSKTGPSDVHFPAEASFHHKVRHEQRAARTSRALRHGSLLPQTPTHPHQQ